jgi:FixJ family two-component response regulator
MSGIDVRRRLTQAGCSVPVVFITGLKSQSTLVAALEAGCVAVLTKPFASSDLIDAIGSTVQGATTRPLLL